MKKYFIAVAAMAFLAACSGKQAQNVPVEVEEESVTVAEVIPMPVLPPALKEKPSKPVNMRDSLKVNPKKGAVVQKKYKATVPPASATAPSVSYDLTMYYQQDAPDGVYEMDAVVVDAGSGQSKAYISTGKGKMLKGTPEDAEAVVYELIPSDGSPVIYFEAEGSNLTLLDDALSQDASGLQLSEQK